jgi:hypothetical protein
MCVPSTTLVEIIMEVCMETQNHSKVVFMFFSLQNLSFMGWMAIWQVASWGVTLSWVTCELQISWVAFQAMSTSLGVLFRYFLVPLFGFVVSSWQCELKPGNTIVNMHQERGRKNHQLCCTTDTGIEPLITEPDGTRSSPTTKPIP